MIFLTHLKTNVKPAPAMPQRLIAVVLAGLALGANTLAHSGTVNQVSGSSAWVSQNELYKLVEPGMVPTGGTVQVELVKEDARLGSQQCPVPLFSTHPNGRLWGRSFVQVNCVGSNLAPFYLNVDVKVFAPVAVMKNAVPAGQAFSINDVEFKTLDITQLGNGWLSDVSHLSNKTAVRAMWPGMVVKNEQLKGTTIVKTGDQVKVILKGPGFSIGAQAVALENAGQGELVKIKTDQGKILSGTAVDELLVEVAL